MKRNIKLLASLMLVLIMLFLFAGCAETEPEPTEPVDLSGWINQDGIIRYRDEKGNLVRGWQTLEGNLYFFHPETGDMAMGWKQIGNTRYYFDSNGVRATGWVREDGKSYYLDAEGKLLRGWQTVEEQKYYFTDDGSMANDWLIIDGEQYRFDDMGKMLTGWQSRDGENYFLTEAGTPHTGWLDFDGKRYCFDEEGKMLTGWLTEGEDRYYLLETGAMAVGRVDIDGVANFFTSKGKYTLMVNPWVPVPDDYQIELVDIEGFQFDISGRDALQALILACRAEGYACNINNTYRSRATQQWMWDNSVSKKMAAGMTYQEAVVEAGKTLALPGHSEHQTGLAVDILGSEKMYAWMAANCWDYGFILRYPDDRYEITGIIYEPWHFRYVGMELAQEMKGTNLSLEEYFANLTEPEEA